MTRKEENGPTFTFRVDLGGTNADKEGPVKRYISYILSLKVKSGFL